MSYKRIGAAGIRHLDRWQKWTLRNVVLPSIVEEAKELIYSCFFEGGVTTFETLQRIEAGIDVRQQGMDVIIEFSGAAETFDEGWGTFDMKSRLLDEKAKISEDGTLYRDVPMKHNEATRLDATDKMLFFGGSVLQREARAFEGNLLMRGIEAGSRINPANEKYLGSAQIRRVSEDSDPHTWIHPGRPKLDIAERVGEEMAERLGSRLENL